MIELTGVSKAFDGHSVLRGLDLTVAAGETVVILGRSGTGKSVTLKHIVGLIPPDEGSIRVDGREVVGANRQALRTIRKQVAYLFQNGALVNWMSVRDNVALPLVEHAELPPAEISQRVDETLEKLDMLSAAARYPGEISGGMRKRAALCRVLVAEPRAILYDEPTAGLDPIMARIVAGLIERVGAEHPERSAVVVTHDLELAFAVADRIGLHHDGRITVIDTPDRFRDSDHPVIRAFLDGRTTPEETRP